MSLAEIFEKYQNAFASGLTVTLELCSIAWIIGLTLGALLGWLSYKSPHAVGWLVRMISFILSCIPVLVLLFWVHYPLQTLFEIVINPFYSAAAVLSLINLFNVAMIVRNGLNELPRQFLEAAMVCGISKAKIFSKIQFPLLMRVIIPSILTNQINILHLSLFASLISVEEIFRICQQVNSQIYQPVEIFTALAILFIIVCFPLNLLAHHLRNKYQRDFSEK